MPDPGRKTRRIIRVLKHRIAKLKARGRNPRKLLKSLRRHRAIHRRILLSNSPRQKAIRWARKQVGTTENPAGSNRGFKITRWQKSFGAWLVGLPWCGVFAGKALKKGGVKDIMYRVASVAAIEDDARWGKNGFAEWRPPSHGKPGDLAVIGGRGVHVELIEARVPGGYRTIGGNTSPAGRGSLANGGGVFQNFRPYNQVHGIAVPRYPR